MKTGQHIMRALLLLSVWLGLGAMAHAGTHHFYYTDPQGTVLAKADASGNIIATYDYAPYGSQALGSPTDGPGYTGHVNDSDTGLVYMQARYYDPAVGRFLSTDPVGPSPGNTFHFNRYDYANNNPIVNIDPNGRESSNLSIQGAQAIQSDLNQMSPEEVREDSGIVAGALPVVGDVQNISAAVSNPSALNIAVAVVGAIPEIGGAAAGVLKEASAADRAVAIAGTMSARTQRAVTIAVTETKEGVRVVSSSEGSLRPAARAALTNGEVAAKGAAGTHAEVNGVNAAKDMGLTPTGTAASRPICSACAQNLEQQGVAPLSPLKQ